MEKNKDYILPFGFLLFMECQNNCISCIMQKQLEKEEREKNKATLATHSFLMGLGTGTLLEYA